MGTFSKYQAVPEDSDLHRLLEADPEANATFAEFALHGCVPLDLREAGDDEVAEILDGYADGEESAVASARAAIDRLEVAIGRTRVEYLGLEERSASLEKTFWPIHAWIKARCMKTGRADGPTFADELLCGNARLGSFGKLDAAAVRRAAAFFREPDALALSPEEEKSFGNDLRALADLCLVADECDEVLLVHSN